MLPTSRGFKVGKHEVVACLTWQPLPGMDGVSYKTEMRALAKENIAEYGAYYENPGSRYHTVGLLGAERPAQFVGKTALAPWLADTVERRLIYLEAMDARGSTYYLLSVTPGYVDPRTDRVVNDDEAAQLISEMLDELYQPNSKGVDFFLGGDVAPPSSNMLERHPPTKKQLVEILTGAPPKHLRVKQILGVPPKAVYSGLGLVALALLLVGAGLWWRNHQRQIELQQQMDAMLAQAQEQQKNAPDNLADLRIQQALTDQLAIDSQTYTPSQFVRACQATQHTFKPMIGGWSLVSIVCDPAAASATASYTRVTAGSTPTGATNGSFVAAATAIGLHPTMDFATDTVSVAVPLIGLAKRPALTMAQLPARSKAAVYIPSQFQALSAAVSDAKTTVGAPTPVDVKYNDPAKANDAPETQQVSVPPERTYLKGSISLTSNSTWVLNGFNLDWPNLAIARLAMRAGDLGQEEWTLEATYLVANG